MKKHLPLALAAALSLGACAPLVLTGAGVAGMVGLQDRPVKQTAEDVKLDAAIKANLTQAQFAYLTDIGTDVFYGDVVLTGVLPTQADGERVLDITRRTPGVQKVYNELFIGSAYSAAQRARDAWIAAQIRARLIGTQQSYPLNYLLSVVNGHVYVSGNVASEQERAHTLHVLRTTRGVVQVHDYLRFIPTSETSVMGSRLRTDSAPRAPDPFKDLN